MHGMVETILTDQAQNFEANLIAHLCKLLGANKIKSSPYHPKGNGITERVNRVVKPAISKFVDEAGEDWDLYLPMAISSYSTAHHSSIGLTPYEAHFGRPAKTVADVVLNRRLPSMTDLRTISGFTVGMFDRAEQIQKQIMDSRILAQDKQRKQYNKNVAYERTKFKNLILGI